MRILWFRQDLRLDDHAALAAATGDGQPVLAIYIHHPTLMGGAPLTSKHAAFMRGQVDQFKEEIEALGGQLLIFTEPFTMVFGKLLEALGPFEVHANRVLEPAALTNDQVCAQWGEDHDCRFHFYDDACILKPGTIRSEKGTVHKVFTTFYKKWRKEFHPVPILMKRPSFVSLAEETPIRLHKLIGDRIDQTYSPDRVATFLGDPIRSYKLMRDRVDLDATSHLSQWINCGRVSVRTLLQQVKEQLETETDPDKQESIEAFIRQLAWRDFYIQVMDQWPEVRKEAFIKHFQHIPWENDKDKLVRWQTGHTGVPIVDAAMRCLRETGTLHNRLRMIVASFLVKDLHINWQEGEAWFRDHLIDYNLPLNNGGWQWSASTGTDAHPYFRIFNPYRQSEKHDPQGTFIRKYLPELSGLTGSSIHAPHEAPMELMIAGITDADYPYPLVDHRVRSEEAKNMFEQARKLHLHGQKEATPPEKA